MRRFSRSAACASADKAAQKKSEAIRGNREQSRAPRLIGLATRGGEVFVRVKGAEGSNQKQSEAISLRENQGSRRKRQRAEGSGRK